VAIAARNFGFDRGLKHTHRSGLPIISVGNLSVGGTGKSPAVAWIARWLRQREVRVAILSRGYGQLDSGQNDEALELELQLPDVPHLQHWDRVASARLAEDELDMQVLLLDDGFQHRRMARDLEIVLLDASEPHHARQLLPGGLLREPLSSLRRADLIMLTRSDQADARELDELSQQVNRTAPQAKLLLARHRPCDLLIYPDKRQSLEPLRGQAVLAFCAIGNPESFFNTLTRLGAKVLGRRTWPDHHAYAAADVDSLADWGRQFPEAELLICTVKDWVKLQSPKIGGLPLAALTIELEVTSGLEGLEGALEGIVRSLDDNPEEYQDG
jgi:tetraacyldisaccharide 4'-kinase